MSKVITFSTKFPAYHPKAGKPTFFVEKIYNIINVPKLKSGFFYQMILKLNPERTPTETLNFYDAVKRNILETKSHTIRSGYRFKVGDKFSPRVWSGKPYNSKQIIIAEDIEVKKVFDFKILAGDILIGSKHLTGITEADFELLEELAKNDGLDRHDLLKWFQYPKAFEGQIICWNDKIEY